MRRASTVDYFAYVVALAFLFLTPQATYATESQVAPEDYSMACGPVSCWVSLRLLGLEVTLEDCIRRCNWAEGETTSFSTIVAALMKSNAVTASDVRISPTELYELLRKGNAVAILKIKRFSDVPNHAVAVYCNESAALAMIDPPGGGKVFEVSELSRIWDGEAIIVTRSASSLIRDNVGYFLLPIIALVAIARWSILRRSA